MPKALISVTDKSGVAALAGELVKHDYEILSTGGTAALLRDHDIHVTDIATYTQSPEMLQGRVKTLHPRIFAGILGRPDKDHEEFEAHGFDAIAVVVVNLYEFQEAIAHPDTVREDAIEAIDIGGVSLIRAAAKNSDHVLVVVDPNDYDDVGNRLRDGNVDQDYRHRMAAKAFRHTAAYDAAIARYLSSEEPFPERLTVSYVRDATMRYGENPHQAAALYRDAAAPSGNITQLQGKSLSYNNIADTHAAWRSVSGLDQPACAIVKHANPCGLAVAADLRHAYENAFRTDPTSAFGGVIAFNHELDATTLARVLDNQFAEVIVAPSITADAIAIAKRKKSLRLLTFDEIAESEMLKITRLEVGALVQEADSARITDATWEIKTERAPTEREADDLRFAWHVVKHVKSNAIVFARDGATTGIGAGQPNRVVSVRIAAMRMQEEGLDSVPSVMASDAFFPFRDGIDRAAEAGITAVIQPGGSVRDPEVIEACDEHDIAMVATAVRHFLH